MANNKLDMNKIRKVIKLHCNSKSKLFISRYLSLSRNTVKKYIYLFEVLGLSLETVNKKTDTELDELFSQGPTEVVFLKNRRSVCLFSSNGTGIKKGGYHHTDHLGKIY